MVECGHQQEQLPLQWRSKLRRSGESLRPVNCRSSYAWWSVVNNKNSYLYSDVVSSVGQVKPFGESSVGPVVRVVDGGVGVNKTGHVRPAHCGAHWPRVTMDTAFLILEPVPVG